MHYSDDPEILVFYVGSRDSIPGFWSPESRDSESKAFVMSIFAKITYFLPKPL
jgi:hypothetical protein